MRPLALVALLASPALAQNCIVRELWDVNLEHSARFGAALDFDGRWAAIGAPENSDAGAEAGAVMFVDVIHKEIEWRVLDPDATPDDEFGAAVGVDENHVVVGAPGANAVYVLERETGSVLHRLTPSLAPGRFGERVAIAGGRILVGACDTAVPQAYQGAAYVFDAATGAELHAIPGPVTGGRFGTSVALDDTYAVVGAHNDSSAAFLAGAAYLIDLTTGQVLLQVLDHTPSGGEDFGAAVAISGGRMLVGNPRDDPNFPGAIQGSVGVYAVPGGNLLNVLAPDGAATLGYFGSALDVDGDRTVVGAPLYGTSSSGRVSVFETGSGQLLGHLGGAGLFGGDSFGSAIAVSGDWALVGLPGHAPASTSTPDSYGSARFFALEGPDCDNNGTLDACHVVNAPGLDLNDNLVPDSCELLGQGFCQPSVNSSGVAATIFALGSPALLDQDFTLGARQAAYNQFGYFLMSTSQDFVPGFGGSEGNLCLGAPIVRVLTGPQDVLFTGGDGTVLLDLDFDALPQSVVFQPGDTWHFQFWFRDVVNSVFTSNTTRGLSITFE